MKAALSQLTFHIINAGTLVTVEFLKDDLAIGGATPLPRHLTLGAKKRNERDHRNESGFEKELCHLDDAANILDSVRFSRPEIILCASSCTGPTRLELMIGGAHCVLRRRTCFLLSKDQDLKRARND